MKTFASVVDLFGDTLMEEELLEDDRKYEGMCMLLPGVLGGLWPGAAAGGGGGGGGGGGEVRACTLSRLLARCAAFFFFRGAGCLTLLLLLPPQDDLSEPAGCLSCLFGGKKAAASDAADD